MRCGIFVWAAIALMLAPCAASLADDKNLLEKRFYVAVGSFINASTMKIRLDGQAGEIGTPIEWSRTFGDQEKTRLRADALWRIGGRHYMRFMYTDYSRSSSRRIAEEITWEGDVIPVDAVATGTFSFEVIEAAYEYAFIKRPDLEVAGSLGLHYTTLEATLTAQVSVGGESGTVKRGGDANVDAPLPVIGARALWRFSDNWYLDGLAQAFYLSTSDLEGSILNSRVAVLWQPVPRFGLGAGFDWFRTNVDSEDPGFRGNLNWTYQGPQLFFSLAF